MSIDYSNADEIARIFRDEASAVFAANFHADTYEIYKTVRVSDGSGGTVPDEVFVEGGRCDLQTFSANWGGERSVDAYLLAEAKFILELPLTTALETSHIVYVNGRRFTVANVVRDGNDGMFVYAAIDEDVT